MLIRLQETQSDDLNFVLSAEQSQENRPFVVQWSKEQHSNALINENMAHMVVEAETDGRRVGYVILAGIGDPNQNIEFKRIVITEKSKGFGRSTVKAVKHYAFECLGAHRLWLNVLETNTRARTLYESEGFRFEGLLRECWKTANGYQSLILMSILEQDYKLCCKI